MRLFRLIALMLVLAPVPARAAFESLNLRSGMTPDQVRAAAPTGYALMLSGDFGFIEKGNDTYATVTFCRGRLISVSRTIEAQTEWFSLADKMIRQYGNPKVTAAANPWADAQEPGSNGLEMTWRSGQNKYALTAFPVQRPKGGAKPAPTASISVTDFGPGNACVPRSKVVHAIPAKARLARHPRARLHRVSWRRTTRPGPSRPASGAPAVVRVQASVGGEASLRYPAGTREAASLENSGAPAEAPPPRDPIRRFFSFLKKHFGSGGHPESEQVASQGGRS